MSSVVLFSGGLDSTVLVSHLVIDQREGDILLLSVFYGSKHNLAELTAAEKLYATFQDMFTWVRWARQTIVLPDEIFKGGKSTLMERERDVPIGPYNDMDKVGPSTTVVPFRNANLISVATSIADKEYFSKVCIAVHASDHNKWTYPDCTPEFIGAMMNAVHIGTYYKVRLQAPFLYMSKADVVALGARIGAPIDLTWSCYKGGSYHCGECPTCVERKNAFKIAKVHDSTKYGG